MHCILFNCDSGVCVEKEYIGYSNLCPVYGKCSGGVTEILLTAEKEHATSLIALDIDDTTPKYLNSEEKIEQVKTLEKKPSTIKAFQNSQKLHRTVVTDSVEKNGTILSSNHSISTSTIQITPSTNFANIYQAGCGDNKYFTFCSLVVSLQFCQRSATYMDICCLSCRIAGFTVLARKLVRFFFFVFAN